MRLSGTTARCVRVVFHYALALVLPVAGTAFADTEVGGRLSVDTLWRAASSPYVVTSTVTIADGATLSIEAGTVVHMAAGTNLAVQSGGVVASGSPAAPVRITSYRARPGDAPAAGDWGKVIFSAGTVAAKTRLENTVIEYGQGVEINGASPTLNAVSLNHHSGPAITLDLTSSPVGNNVSAQGNQINGIVVPAGIVQGNVRWGIQGIPYVLSVGQLSVGAAPSLSAVTPRTFEQGEQVSISLQGARLSGLEQLRFQPPIQEASILAGASDTSAGVSLRIPEAYPPGSVSISAVTNAGEVSMANAFSVTAMQAPRIVGITPRTIARNTETVVLLDGSSLGAATVSTVTPGLQITGGSATSSQLSFRVRVDGQTTPAAYPFTLSNAAGQAAFSLEVIPELAPPPSFSLIPALVTLAPDSAYRTVLFSTAQSAPQDRTYAVQIEDPTVTRVRSASFTLPAGQLSVPISVAGLKLGATVLRISGDGLTQPLEAPVSVVAGGYQQVSVAPVVGVVRGEQFTGGALGRVAISNTVGIVVGNGNTTNVANYRVVGSAVGVVRGSPYGGASFVVSPVVRINRQ